MTFSTPAPCISWLVVMRAVKRVRIPTTSNATLSVFAWRYGLEKLA